MAQTLLQKLRIRTGDRVAVLNAPDTATGLTMEIPLDVSVSHELQGTFQQIHCFVRNSAELDNLFPQAIPALEASGLLWIYFPKKSSKIQTDLSRDAGWERPGKAGFHAVSLIGLDDTWSAFAFRRGDTPVSRPARQGSSDRTKYIDQARRTIRLPADVRKAFKTRTNAARAFHALSFTHRREYIEWVLDARQAETRTRRIRKLVAELTKGPK
jgi:hypothetical protein